MTTANTVPAWFDSEFSTIFQDTVFSEKKLFDHPIIGNRVYNILGLHPYRMCMAHRIYNAFMEAKAAEAAENQETAKFHHDIVHDGVAAVYDVLPQDLFSELKGRFSALGREGIEKLLGDPIDVKYPFEGLAARSPHFSQDNWRYSYYQHGAIFREGDAENLTVRLYETEFAPLVKDLVTTPRMQAFFKMLPEEMGSVDLLLISARKFEHPLPDPQSLFHADTFHPTFKAWLFLDCEEALSFRYLAGSHRLTSRRLMMDYIKSLAAASHPNDISGSFRYDRNLPQLLGLNEVRRFNAANTFVVANTFGLHARDYPARPATRLSLAFGFRRRPFCGNERFPGMRRISKAAS